MGRCRTALRWKHSCVTRLQARTMRASARPSAAAAWSVMGVAAQMSRSRSPLTGVARCVTLLSGSIAQIRLWRLRQALALAMA